MRARRFTPLFVIMAALVLLGTSSPWASAATPPVSSVFSHDDLDEGYGAERLEYGGALGVARFPLPVATTKITVAFRFFESDGTRCTLSTVDGAVISDVYWGPEVWTPPDVIPVPSGQLRTGTSYDLACISGYYGENSTTWHLVGAAGSATTVGYDEKSRAALVRTVSSEYAFISGSIGNIRLARGERFRVASYPDFWKVSGTAQLSGTIATDADAPESPMGQVTLGPGDAYVDATVPADLSSAYDTAWIRVTRTGTVPGSVGVPEKVTFRQVFLSPQLVTKASTTTTLKLDAGTVVSYRPKATVRVSTTDGSAPVGEVVLVVDGRADVATVRLDGTEGGVAVLRVPRLSRGVHSVVAVFRDGTLQLGSASTARPLRQLL